MENFELHVCRVGVRCLWKLQAMPKRQLKCWESPNNGSAERLGDGGETVATCGRLRDREFRRLHPNQQPSCPRTAAREAGARAGSLRVE